MTGHHSSAHGTRRRQHCAGALVAAVCSSRHGLNNVTATLVDEHQGLHVLHIACGGGEHGRNTAQALYSGLVVGQRYHGSATDAHAGTEATAYIGQVDIAPDMRQRHTPVPSGERDVVRPLYGAAA